MITNQASNPSINITANSSLPLQRTTYRDPDTGQSRMVDSTCIENGLDMEQHYQPLERFHASGLHGWGIVTGLHVAATLNSTGVTVQQGIALDSNGLHILLVGGVLAEVSQNPDTSSTLLPVSSDGMGGVIVPTDGLTGDKFLVIQFHETFDSQANADHGFFRYTHTPWLHFVDAAPTDGSSLVLTKVTFDTGANAGQVLALAQDLRQRADGHVERNHETSIHGPGVVAGLDVTVTNNSAGITILPGVALDGAGQYVALSSGGQVEVGAAADAPGATPNLIPVPPASVPPTGVQLSTDGLTGDKFLTIQYWETPIPVTLPLPTNTPQVAPVRFVYTPWLRLTDAATFPNDTRRIVLAKITFGTGTSTGLVTNFIQGPRQGTDLGVGSIHLFKSTSFSPTATSRTVKTGDAGLIRALPTGTGLAISAPTASDEIHLERGDGGNIAKVSLGATQIVARNATGAETVTINSEAGSVSSTSMTTSTLTATGPSIQQNKLYLSGGPGWSSLSYNARHNDANTAWVFPDTTRPAITVEMDDSFGGAPRFQVFSTTKSNPTAWVLRFAVDGSTGAVSTNGGEIAAGNITGTGLHLVTNGNINTDNGSIFTHGGSIDTGGGSITISNGGFLSANNMTAASATFTGSLRVFGQKNFVQEHPTDSTKEIVYTTLEGGESGTYIRGTATLVNGKAVIDLPEHFSLVTSEEGLTIQLTPRGEWLQLYAVQVTTTQVIVQEAQEKSAQFDYQVQGVRKGYENPEVIQSKNEL